MDDSVAVLPQNTGNAGFKGLLRHLHTSPCPHVPNPTACKKRASVALVIRIRPRPQQKASYDPQRCSTSVNSFDECLDNFFDQDWVHQGEPEVLFIKRASRVGDRWTSQVALPGGGRDPQDVDDRAASVRETLEETALELEKDYCLEVGNLPERLLTTTWGKQPIMVLCPFVYLMLRHDTPPLDLQPAEVHSAHWVSVYSLLAPSLRTSEFADISDRAQPGGSTTLKRLVRLTSGQMEFSAVKLLPSESVFSPLETSSTLPEYSARSQSNEKSLLLWGLTLGVMADFLHSLDPKATERLWSWPTFSHWDIRLVVWLLTRSFRLQRECDIQTMKFLNAEDTDSARVHGMDPTTYATSSSRSKTGHRTGLAGAHLLDNYFEKMYKAVTLALGLRCGIFLTAIAVLAHRYRQRGR